MSSVFDAPSWEAAEQKLLSIEEKYRARLPGVWFRGHSDAKWPLLSTLERRIGNIAVLEYYRVIYSIAPEILALTGQQLQLSFETADSYAHNYDSLYELLIEGYSAMAHLRHHGFPSPLLDWSASPYVAAYFAFASALQSERIAIYVYVEAPKHFKLTSIDQAQIKALGPIVRTHARHFRQQSRYTVCSRYKRDQGGWHFTPHGDVFDAKPPSNAADQDFLWKITIPASERTRVLSALDRYNLNAYSLFGSEESLMETLASRHLDRLANLIGEPARK